jgi:hypothetical protein
MLTPPRHSLILITPGLLSSRRGNVRLSQSSVKDLTTHADLPRYVEACLAVTASYLLCDYFQVGCDRFCCLTRPCTMAMLPCSTTRTMQRTATAPKAAVHQQTIRSSVVCKALPDRQQQVANVAAFAATVSVLSSIAFAPVALADLNVYEAAAGGGLRYAPAAATSGTLLVHVGHTSNSRL